MLRVSTLPDKGEESLVTTLLDREGEAIHHLLQTVNRSLTNQLNPAIKGTSVEVSRADL